MQPFYLTINSFLGRNEIPDCDCFKKGQKETKIDFLAKDNFSNKYFARTVWEGSMWAGEN